MVRENLNVQDVPVLGAMNGSDLLKWTDSEGAKALPEPIRSLLMIDKYVEYQIGQIGKSISMTEYAFDQSEDQNAHAAHQVAKVCAMAINSLNSVSETYDAADREALQP